MDSRCRFSKLAQLSTSLLVVLVVLLAGAFGQAASVSDAEVVTATQDQKSAETSVTTKQEVQLRLPAQPGTGFSWTLLNKVSLVKLKGQSTEPAAKAQPGAWQTQVFRFKAKKAGSETLEFGYRRSWEKGTPPAKTFSLRITIADSK
jgi:predicted secreted protein